MTLPLDKINWSKVGLWALLGMFSMAGGVYTKDMNSVQARLDKQEALTLSNESRLAKSEAQNIELLKRLERIENKLDQLLTERRASRDIRDEAAERSWAERIVDKVRPNKPIKE